MIRFAEIDLLRFGHFDGQRLSFAQREGEHDLHIIVGANEAGKTTLKHALLGLLFGAGRRNIEGYRQLYSKLRVAGTVVVDGTPHSLTREDAKGRPASADRALSEALAAADVTLSTYANRHAFSHEEMREHSEALHQSDGDLKDLVLRDAGGLSQANKQLEALGEEADELYSTRKRNARLKVLKKEREQALAEREAALLDAPAFAALVRAAREARAQAEAAKATAYALKDQVDACDRLVRLEPVVRGAAELRRLIEENDAPLLAPDAQERVREAMNAEREAIARLEELNEQIAQLGRDLAAHPPDEAAVAVSEEVANLRERSARIADTLAARKSERERAAAERAEAHTLARGLDLAFGDALEEALPGEWVRSEIVRHANRWQTLISAAERANEELARAKERPLPDEVLGPDPLLTALAKDADGIASLRGDHADRLLALANAERACLSARDHEYLSIDPERLPTAQDGREHERQIIEAAQRVAALSEEFARSEREIADRNAKVARAKAAALPTLGVVAAARAERDRLWLAVQEQGLRADLVSAFASAQKTADDRADQRADRASEIVAAERDLSELAGLTASAEKAGEQVRGAQDTLHELQAAWGARLSAAGLSVVPPDWIAWLERYKTFQDAQERAEAARTALEVTEARLRGFLERVGPPRSPGEGAPQTLGADALGFATAEAAERIIERHQAVSERRRAWEAAKAAWDSAQEDLPARERAQRAADEALCQWTHDWDVLLANARLAKSIPAASAPEFCDQLADIESLLQNARHREERCAAADAQERTIKEALAEVADRLDMAGAPLSAIAARVENAERRQADRQRLLAARAEQYRNRPAREQAVDEARKPVRADLAAAGLPLATPLAQFRSVAARSDARHAHETALASAIATIAREKLTEEEARAAIDGRSEAALEAAADEARTAVRAHEGVVSAAAENNGIAQNALADAEKRSRGGRDAATIASANVRAKELEIAQAAREAIARRLETIVLSHARDRFSEAHASPILSRAAPLFAELTGGNYDALLRSVGTGETSLVRARRAEDHAEVDVDALSAGTRDQLVLAVRLAAAEGCALPFIADDILVNADDRRARRALGLLYRLAGERQVLYLTHHDHLVALAQDALGDHVNVVRL